MYTPPWIPRADATFQLFAHAFCGGIDKDPARYMTTPAEAASLMQALQRFNDSLRIASNQATRTKGAIAAKDDARSILQSLIESYAPFIRANSGITDEDKISIGVRPRNITRTKRTCPNTPPMLKYIGSVPGVDELRYHDTSTPTSKAKPRGAERLELWVSYSSEPKPKVSDARLVGSFKKSRMLVEQDAQRDVRLGASGPGTGMPIYWARWVGFDGSKGPWSPACGVSSQRNTPGMKIAA